MKYSEYIMFDFAGTIVKMRRPLTLLPEYGLIMKLAGKYRLGLITGAKRSEVLNIVKKLKIRDFLDIIITADDTPYRKPDPRLFPDRTIKAYVGDTRKDEIFAKNRNITFFRVSKKCNINDILNIFIND